MKAFVLTDESLREQAGQFVWLAIDTEKAVNASFKIRYPVKALPTFLVIEPASERVLLRWVGGATVPQVHELLEDARDNYSDFVGGQDGSGEPDADADPGELLIRADLLYGEGKSTEAAALYERAIDSAPEGWPSYARAVEGLLLNLLLDGNCEAATALAREAAPRLEGTTSMALLSSVGLDCALELPDDHAEKSALVAFFENSGLGIVRDLSIPVAADDRSGLYISLWSSRKAAGDSLAARALAQEWSAFLEKAAAEAPTPEARTVFDSHRLYALLQLEEPDRAVAFLQASERDFPDDYNPPARLAIAYREMGQLDEALAASERAIALGYGPRLLGILQTHADLLVRRGDDAAAFLVLEDALELARSMPEGQRSERRIQTLEEKLASIQTPP